MLKIENTYDDRDVTVTARRSIDGVDGTSTTLEPGETGAIDLDGDHQLSISTRARVAGEEPLGDIPVAAKVTREPAKPPEPQLKEPSDDEVRAEVDDMVTTKSDLTKGGFPELPALNARLAAKGLAPVDAVRRDALMKTPA